jgi:hypothetical protein
MASLRRHGTLKSFGHPTYGLQYQSTIDINRSPINAHQFNNQLDRRSHITRTFAFQTEEVSQIWFR